jgi:hypothetical protein
MGGSFVDSIIGWVEESERQDAGLKPRRYIKTWTQNDGDGLRPLRWIIGCWY